MVSTEKNSPVTATEQFRSIDGIKYLLINGDSLYRTISVYGPDTFTSFGPETFSSNKTGHFPTVGPDTLPPWDRTLSAWTEHFH